jgi:hypothetical protein
MFRTVQEDRKASLHVFEVLAVDLMKITVFEGVDF